MKHRHCRKDALSRALEADLSRDVVLRVRPHRHQNTTWFCEKKKQNVVLVHCQGNIKTRTKKVHLNITFIQNVDKTNPNFA